LPRLVGGAAFTAFAVWAIAGPPFFPHRSAPLAGTAARVAAGQSLVTNGNYRLDFWREAFAVFRRFPITGGGYHSLATESIGHVPAGWPISPLAHNAYLQVLASGGLLLGVPFLLGCAAIAWFAIRELVRELRTPERTAVGVVVPLALGALMLHAAVDFDWSYPANFLLAAVVAGLVMARHWQRRPEPHPHTRSRATAAIALIGLALTGLAAITSWSGDMRLSLPVAGASTQQGVR
jgi:O-antigen ligase